MTIDPGCVLLHYDTVKQQASALHFRSHDEAVKWLKDKLAMLNSPEFVDRKFVDSWT